MRVGVAEDLDPLLALADAVVVGPGLGRSEWASGLWHRSLETNLPLIVDADALNLLAGSPPRAGPLDPDSASGGGRAAARQSGWPTCSSTGSAACASSLGAMTPWRF